MGSTVRRTIGGAVALCAAALGTACGGGGGGRPGDPTIPSVVSVRFVGPDGADVGAIHKDFVPRNAWIEILFSAEMAPASVVEPAIKVRAGPYFDQPSLGTFHVQGHRVLFDPSVLGNGGARPFGFDAGQTHRILVPSGVPSGEMVRSTGGAEPIASFSMEFRTTEEFVREDVPPHLVAHRVVSPLPDPSGRLWADTILELEFDEAIDPRSLRASLAPTAAESSDAIDVRFEHGVALNESRGVAGRAIPVQLVPSADAKRVRLVPMFPIADAPYVFAIRVLPALRDLAGNAFVPTAFVGPFTCVGDGVEVAPDLLAERFTSATDQDPAPTDAAWGEGLARANAVTTRRAYVLGAKYVNADAALGTLGLRLVSPMPLIGADLDLVAPQVPPAYQGRRLQLAFDRDDLGPSGAVIQASWGPDRNATFPASYPQVVLKLGHTADGMGTDLTETFAANHSEPLTTVYSGPYDVAQRANVGNEAPAPTPFAAGTAFQPLFDYTGFVHWPTFTTFFEWDAGTPGTATDRGLLFEVDAKAGSTWQECRAYFRGPLLFPPGAGGGLPLPPPAGRRLASTSGGTTANPASTAVTPNPDPTIHDTAFTIAKIRATAQSRFYTPGPTGEDGVAYPAPHSLARTYGTASDYAPVQFLSSSIPTGTSVRIEYQGAMALDPTSGRTRYDAGAAATPWTTDVDDCDGYPYLRWRITLVADPTTGARPQVGTAVVPVRRLP